MGLHHPFALHGSTAFRLEVSLEITMLYNGAQVDLPAADGQYHSHCYNNFIKVAIDSTKSESAKPRVDDAVQADISHMRENMCVT